MIPSQEMNRLIGQAAAQYQPADRERFIKYVQNDAMAAAQLRAPLYEDKVVDFLFSKAEISERGSTRAELEADLESEEGHVHGPGCGHDVPAAKAPAKKAAKGKAEAKPAKAEAKPAKAKAEAPAKGPVERAAAKPKPAKQVKDAAPAKATPKAPAKAAKAPAKKAAAKPAAKKPAAKKN